MWSFGNDFAKNALIFGVDNSLGVYNSLSSHADNWKNIFLSEGPTYDINASLPPAEKNFNINFTKEKTKFCLRLHHNGDGSDLFVNKKNI